MACTEEPSSKEFKPRAGPLLVNSVRPDSDPTRSAETRRRSDFIRWSQLMTDGFDPYFKCRSVLSAPQKPDRPAWQLLAIVVVAPLVIVCAVSPALAEP